jgi:hypothetical protein
MLIENSLAAITKTTNFIKTIKKQAIVKPTSLKEIGGFRFDIVDSDSIKIQSEITDHYIEDNSVIHDHIALPPERVSVVGFTGELLRYTTQVSAELTELEVKLNDIGAYSSEFSVPIKKAYDAIKTAIDLENKAFKATENLFSVFDDNFLYDKRTRQAKLFSYFYSLWEAREIFTVDTPYKTFPNMAIESMDVRQGTSDGISEFDITFKKLRFADITIEETSQERRAIQLTPIKNVGQIVGKRTSALLQTGASIYADSKALIDKFKGF